MGHYETLDAMQRHDEFGSHIQDLVQAGEFASGITCSNSVPFPSDPVCSGRQLKRARQGSSSKDIMCKPTSTSHEYSFRVGKRYLISSLVANLGVEPPSKIARHSCRDMIMP